MTTETRELEDKLLSISEVQQILGCGRSTVYRIFEADKLRSVKVGKSRRVWSKDVRAYIDMLLAESGDRLKAAILPDGVEVLGEIDAS